MSGSTRKKTKVKSEPNLTIPKSKKKKASSKNSSSCQESNVLDNVKTRFEDTSLLNSAEFDNEDSNSKFFNIKSVDSVESNSPILDRQTEPPKSIDINDVVDEILFEKQKDFFQSPEMVEIFRNLKDS